MTKFERDKVYKTRDGREARVICVDAPGKYPVVGVVDDGIRQWTADGWYNYARNYDGSQMYSHSCDLMLPKPEGPVVEWGYIHPRDNVFCRCTSEQYARNLADGPLRLARRTTEIVE